MLTKKKSLLAIVALILVTTAALAALGNRQSPFISSSVGVSGGGNGPVTLSAETVQDKILKDGDGQVTVALNLNAASLPVEDGQPAPAADLVIVLDRSGSMEGQKLADARMAVVGLLEHLGPDDRLALVTYSNGVQTSSPLMAMTGANRRQVETLVNQIRAGGGTHLSAGLQRGIDCLLDASGDGRQRKVILISDGLANQGITGTDALGRMASIAVENQFSVSTVGVGLDFNEIVMTAIADHGAGQYHFLENPRVLARVFETELQTSRQVAAADVGVRIPLGSGVRLVRAGGYPISQENGAAVIHPGNLLSGQSKTLYLTFQAPTDKEKTVELGKIELAYRHGDRTRKLSVPRPLTVACVKGPASVVASIKKENWADQVVQEEFSRLKEAVAADIRDGNKAHAQQRIQDYEARQSTINSVVGSKKVAKNLETDVHELSRQLDETFAGAPAVVAEKKKQVSKAMQYESYKVRRDQK